MPVRLCLSPRCPEPATYRGRCPVHARQSNRQTHRNRSVYGSKRWRVLRERVLLDHPLCQCPDPDCTLIATDVDHIVPIEKGGSVWDKANLQALAASCHGRKTKLEQQGR